MLSHMRGVPNRLGSRDLWVQGACQTCWNRGMFRQADQVAALSRAVIDKAQHNGAPEISQRRAKKQGRATLLDDD